MIKDAAEKMSVDDVLTISGGALKAKITPYGACLTDLRLAGWPHPLVLGFEDFGDYPKFASLFLGAVVGRYANRIAYGKTRVDGTDLSLECNMPPHHVHSASVGFSRRTWTVEIHTTDRICMTVQSPDGEAGYPGKVDVSVIYEITNDATLRIEFQAETTRPTPFNMCHHPYFNLDEGDTIDNHELQIFASQYLPCDSTVLPTGEIRGVENTPFDFREPVCIGERLSAGTTYNNTFCLHDTSRRSLSKTAKVSCDAGVSLELWTTQPGLHVYSGHNLPTLDKGYYGRKICPLAGLCLEAQNWPNGINEPHFPDAILRPDEPYHHITEYRFYTEGIVI